MASKSRFQAESLPASLERAAATALSMKVWVAKVLAAMALVAMVSLLTGCVSGDVPDVPADDEGLVRGQVLYGNNCASCHGNTGSGGVGNRLNNGIVLDRYPDDEAQRLLVIEGRNKMPGFAAKLNDEEIDDVVRYTREIIANQ